MTDDADTASGALLRTVTILFADICESTALVRDRPLLEAASLIRRALSLMIQAVADHHGTVLRCFGDAVLATFEATDRASDDCDRGILAALAMRAALAGKLSIDMTAGLHKGEVYFGRIETEHYQEVTIIGPAANVARRVQEAAGRGQILVSRVVFREVALHHSFREFPIYAKSSGDPMMVAEVLSLS